MPFYKKGMIYLTLFFIIAWMFILGIFVGRGSAPVKFDTRKFQKKLANIAGEYEENHKNSEETDIKFYEALQKPMPEAKNFSNNQGSQEIVSDKSANEEKEFVAGPTNSETKTQIAFKQSQKSLTKGKYSASKSNKATYELKETVKPGKPASTPKRKVDKKAKGKYTIQIAAFQDISGAIQKISSLKAKGYKGYKTKGKVQDQIWHRVRVGHFSDTEVARKYLRKLKQDNINGIIIKQD